MPRARPKTPRRPKLRVSEPGAFIKYAAVWRAVAAADRRAACALALANFVAQSGRTLSVVITVGSLAERDVALRRPVIGGEAIEPREELDDNGEVAEATARLLEPA